MIMRTHQSVIHNNADDDMCDVDNIATTTRH